MKFFLILSFVLFLASSETHAATITLRSDLWCPYACDPKSDHPGFMVELAKEIFEKKGHKVQYDVMNWARAVADVKTGKYDELVGCNKSDVEGFVIPLVPTGRTTSYYYVPKDDNWVYKDKNSLVGKKIGVINDYTYGDEVDNQLKENNPAFKTVAGEKPLVRLIQMAETNRIDGFVENPLVLDYTLKKLKKDKNSFKIVSKDVANDPDLFIAFSPSSSKSKEYTKILDDGMSELRKSGRLKVILARYGLQDWK